MTEKLHGYFSVQLNDRFNCVLFSALQFGTSFAAGVPVSAVPVISVAGAVAAVPKDPPSRVRYAIVCNFRTETGFFSCRKMQVFLFAAERNGNTMNLEKTRKYNERTDNGNAGFIPQKL